MVLKSKDHQTPRSGGLMGVIGRTTLRTLQLITALVIAGLYGRDLHKATSARESADSRWVYAEVVAGFSFLTAAAWLLPFLKSWKAWFWDGVIFLFYLILFGIFGKLYINEDCEGNGSCKRLKVAVWFDMLGMLLWFASTIIGAFLWWRNRRSGGRAAIV